MQTGGAYDCLTIGGGPAGLAAAVYLTRYRRRGLLIDAGASRASVIPLSHNLPGYKDGIGGKELLERQRKQAFSFGAKIVTGAVRNLTLEHARVFVAEVQRPDGDVEQVRARTVLLATGAIDIEPALPGVLDAVARGLIRHCPICDGYEVIDRKIGVIGWGGKCAGEAAFLRTYSSDVTLLSLGRPLELSEDERRSLDLNGVQLEEEPVGRVVFATVGSVAVQFASGRERTFDTVYSALGTKVRSDLATKLGADADSDGALLTDTHQRTSVPGLWAAGDVVSGLNQIAVAFGQAAIAATDILKLGHRLARKRAIFDVEAVGAGEHLKSIVLCRPPAASTGSTGRFWHSCWPEIDPQAVSAAVQRNMQRAVFSRYLCPIQLGLVDASLRMGWVLYRDLVPRGAMS